MSGTASVKLALVDDHQLFRKGLRGLIEMLSPRYEVLFEANNGKDLQTKIQEDNPPDILLLDVNMPEMDGFASIEWLKEAHPSVKVLVVSMIEKEEVIVRMIKLGIKGYLCKDVEPNELKSAIDHIHNQGFYYTDYLTGKLVHSLQFDSDSNGTSEFGNLNDREQDFIRFACTEMTYHQIADEMCLSPKTIDGYRSALFEKLNTKSRVGLAMYAVKNGWVEL